LGIGPVAVHKIAVERGIELFSDPDAVMVVPVIDGISGLIDLDQAITGIIDVPIISRTME
jgi:hypothetical protein